MNNIHLQYHVLIHEVGQCILIGYNASYFGSCQKDVFGTFFSKEFFYLVLSAKVQFFVSTSNEVGISLALQFTDNGTSYHTSMAGNIDF